MSDSRTATASTANRVGSGAGRLVRAGRTLPPERRLAAYAAIGLFLSLFLPWYQRQFFVVLGGKIQPASDSQTAWGAFSFVEAAILLVSAGVLVLLFQRAEGKAFHLPGGDGGVIMAAGVWSAILIIWRIFDKQGGDAHGQNATTYGIEWGIFVALAIAIGLTLAGSRIRAAHRPEPPLPGEDPLPAPASAPNGPGSGSGAPPAETMPLLEARIVPPASDATLAPGSSSASAPAPVPAPASASASAAAASAARPRAIDPEPVDFVPAEPAEFIPRRTSSGPRPAPEQDERPRGWLTARPRHLDEATHAPVPVDRSAPPPMPVPPPVPADDPDRTLPIRRRSQPVAADDPDRTLPTRRRQPPAGDDQLTIPLDHDG